MASILVACSSPSPADPTPEEAPSVIAAPDCNAPPPAVPRCPRASSPLCANSWAPYDAYVVACGQPESDTPAVANSFPQISREDSLRLAISGVLSDEALSPEETAQLATSAVVEQFDQGANHVNLMFRFERGGENHVNAELVWDVDQEVWIAFFDGEGPDGALIIEPDEDDPDDVYRIERE